MKKVFLLVNVIAAFILLSVGEAQAAGYALLGPGALSLSGNFGAAGAELLTRYFHTEIQPKLFPGSSFLSRSLNDDAFVNNNSVELPHAGSNPGVTVDRSSFPATIARRTDAATNYLLEELTTDPTHITDSEALLVAYDKRASVLDAHALTINAKASNRAIYKWAAGATGTHILKSTGATRTASGPSQTGTRKKFTEADIIAARQLFFMDDVVNENTEVGACVLLTPAQYQDLLSISGLMEAQKYGRANYPSGVIDRVLGFDVYVRSSVAVYSNADALKAEGAAAAATDQDAAIFWHPKFVRRAKGATKIFYNAGVAEMYGDIMSAMQRFGAAPARNDNKGIVMMIEDDGV